MEKRILTLIALATAAAIAACAIEAGKVRTSADVPGPSLPLATGNWKGEPLVVSPATHEMLGAARIEAVRYDDGTGHPVDLMLIREDRRRASFHPPEYCFLAASNAQITERGTVRLASGGRELCASVMVVSDGRSRTVVLYWYRIGGHATPSYYAHQFRLVMGLAGRASEHSVMVRLTCRVDGMRTDEAVEKMQSLAAALALI